MRRSKTNEFSAGYDLGFLPESKKMPQIARDQVVSAGRIGALGFGAIRVVFGDGNEAIMPDVTIDEALSAHNLFFSNSQSKAWTNGQGIPLVGLTYDCRPGYRPARPEQLYDAEDLNASSFLDLTGDHLRVVLNPVLKDTTLGWSAIASDGRARFPVAMGRALNQAVKPAYNTQTQQELEKFIVRTFGPVREMGWKITDVSLQMSILNSTVEFTRSDAQRQFPFGPRRFAYLEMTPVDRKKTYPEFRSQFYEALPILMAGLPEFRQINHFASVVALIRLARIDGSLFPTPSGLRRKVITPQYALFTGRGVYRDPEPICQKQ